MALMEICKLRKKYNNFDLKVDNISIGPKEIIGLIGDNGSGKTTILEEIKFNSRNQDVNFNNKKLADNDQDIGFLKSWGTMYSKICIKKFISYYCGSFKKWNQKLFNNLMNKFGFLEMEHSLMGDLSTGQLMQLYFILTICHCPKFLLFDEATSGLDPFVRETINNELKRYVEQNNISIIYSSHIISDIEKIATRILLIHSGKIILDEKMDTLKNDFYICNAEQLNNFPKKWYCIYKKIGKENVIVKVKDTNLKEYLDKYKKNMEELVFAFYGGTYD
jgi:ABC-2 type transport system ATP-binding protein